MAFYFFDSSAIVKRYAVESGSPWIFKILRPSSQNLAFVAGIAGAEVVAALARKRKGQVLSPAEASKAIRRFKRHFSRRFQKISISDKVVATAMIYADRYELRGYDSIQLAAALRSKMNYVLRLLRH